MVLSVEHGDRANLLTPFIKVKEAVVSLLGAGPRPLITETTPVDLTAEDEDNAKPHVLIDLTSDDEKEKNARQIGDEVFTGSRAACYLHFAANIQEAWKKYADEKRYLERWTQPDSWAKPQPQKDPSRKTEYNKPREIKQREDGSWGVIGTGQKITSIETMVLHVIEAWENRGGSKQEEFVKHQLANFSGTRRADIPFILQTLRALTQGKSPAKKQAAFLETPSKMQPRPRQQVVAAANAMQKVLFAHQSIGRILQWSKQSQQDDPPTFFTQFSRVATNIIETGQIAQTSEDIHEADFLVFDGLEYESWLMFGSGDKIVLLQDGKILQMRPPMSLSVVLTKLKQQNQSKCPINMLNLSVKEDNLVPWPLAKHYRIFNEAIAASTANAQPAMIAQAGHEVKTMITKATDIESAIHCCILGQT
ncbi:hypothetical protein L207DRAFT_584735 [Hyaloscypha variabilis F]|uniref:Uncharacterized protein n=1 Tax=Hyaloscypha variabilis (strain UAMH 11265 / GT02V1 / F) TaxID=1149755 RepID=A0A2J6RH07_HYAVF|nr:hypothetical protein L207DRAFT_584735 [Hyaloscypha variabilis F]